MECVRRGIAKNMKTKLKQVLFTISLLVLFRLADGSGDGERQPRLSGGAFRGDASEESASSSIPQEQSQLNPLPCPSGQQRSPVQVIEGERPGSARYHISDGYFFHHQRQSGGRVYLRCVNHGSKFPCPARGLMRSDLTLLDHTPNDHNHGPDHQYERVLALRKNLIEAARVRPGTRLDVIYHEVCRSVHREVSARVSLHAMRSSMARAQNENRPRIPHTFDALHQALTGGFRDLSSTMNGTEPIYMGMAGVASHGHRSLVFMSRRIAVNNAHARTIFCDGTFYSRPSQPQSSQIFSLVIVRDNHVVPILHALMESMTQQAYSDLFQFLRDLLPNLNPECVMSDFEVALMNALKHNFPRAKLSGCLWHYAQAVLRKVRRLGLSAHMRDSDDARGVLRLCLAIPLAPGNRIQEAFQVIQQHARVRGWFNNLAQLFHYIQSQWLDTVGVEKLSVYGLRFRTNNVNECHNRNLNSRVVRRPNVWRFLEVIREVEDQAWRDLARLDRGLAPSRARRVSAVLNDNRVRSCSRQLANGEMSMEDFLLQVCYSLEGTMREGLIDREEERPPSPVRGPPPPHFPIRDCTRRTNVLLPTLTSQDPSNVHHNPVQVGVQPTPTLCTQPHSIFIASEQQTVSSTAPVCRLDPIMSSHNNSQVTSGIRIRQRTPSPDSVRKKCALAAVRRLSCAGVMQSQTEPQTEPQTESQTESQTAPQTEPQLSETQQISVDTNEGQAVIHPIIGTGGDCLFAAISHQLRNVLLDFTPLQLRQIAVDHISQNVNDYHWQLMDLYRQMRRTGEIPCEHASPIDAVLLALRSPSVWGGAECIGALAAALGRTIILYRENAECARFAVEGSSAFEPLRIIHRIDQSLSVEVRNQFSGADFLYNHFDSVVNFVRSCSSFDSSVLGSPFRGFALDPPLNEHGPSSPVLSRSPLLFSDVEDASQVSVERVTSSDADDPPVQDQEQCVEQVVSSGFNTDNPPIRDCVSPLLPVTDSSDDDFVPRSQTRRGNRRSRPSSRIMGTRTLSQPIIPRPPRATGRPRGRPRGSRSSRGRCARDPLRPSPDSEEEMFSDNEENSEENRRWRQCLICMVRVGNWAMVACGAYPICGACIRRWFQVENREVCPHCNGQCTGWVKVRNNNP